MAVSSMSTSRRVAAAALRRVRDGADRARALIIGEGDPEAGPRPGVTRPAGQDGRYAGLWNPSTVTEAISQIYNTEDEANFEEGGKSDSAWLQRLLEPASTVLDLGCGIGRVAYYMAPHCHRLWAVDVSPRMLELARHRLAAFDNVSYALCRDVAIADVSPQSVDLAYSLLVLQHLEREDAFLLLEELHRVLRPRGAAVITFPNLLSETYLRCFTRYAHDRASSQLNRARAYTPQEVERLMPAAGFEIEVLEAGDEIRVTARRP